MTRLSRIGALGARIAAPDQAWFSSWTSGPTSQDITIAADPDGKHIYLALMDMNSAYLDRLCVYKLTTNAVLVWTAAYSFDPTPYLTQRFVPLRARVIDSVLFVAGAFDHGGTTADYASLVKINTTTGAFISGTIGSAAFPHGGSITDYISAADINASGECAFSGATYNSSNSSLPCVFKTDSSGTVQWALAASGGSWDHVGINDSGAVFTAGQSGGAIVSRFSSGGTYGGTDRYDANGFGTDLAGVLDSGNWVASSRPYTANQRVWVEIDSSGALASSKFETETNYPAGYSTPSYGAVRQYGDYLYAMKNTGYARGTFDKRDASSLVLDFKGSIQTSSANIRHTDVCFSNEWLFICGRPASSGNVIAKLPIDGSKTGTYNTGQIDIDYSHLSDQDTTGSVSLSSVSVTVTSYSVTTASLSLLGSSNANIVLNTVRF